MIPIFFGCPFFPSIGSSFSFYSLFGLFVCLFSFPSLFCFSFFFFFFLPCSLVSLWKIFSNVYLKGWFREITKLKSLSCLWEGNVLFCFSQYTRSRNGVPCYSPLSRK